MTKKFCLERLEAIKNNSTTYDYCELKIVESDWANYGKSRTYFKIVEKSTDSKISKHYKEKKYGYLDNQTGEYFPEKYGNLEQNFTFSGMSF